MSSCKVRRYGRVAPSFFLFLCCNAAFARVQTAPPLPFSATVEADSTQIKVASPDDARDVLQGATTDIIALSPRLSPSASAVSPASDWFQWGRFSNRQSPVTLTLDSNAPQGGLRAYAPRSLDGTTLLLVNRVDRAAKIALRYKAQAGFYRIERLLYAPSPPPSESAASAPRASLLSFSGAELAKKGVIQREIELRAGEIVLIRFTELGSLARRAYQNALNLAAQVGDANAANRLRSILQEGEPYLDGVDAEGSASQRAKRYGAFQRILLTISEAQSRIRNYLQQNRVQKSVGEAIGEALQRFEDVLGEIAGLEAGVVGYLRVSPAPNDPAMPNTRAYSAVVTLSHGGQRSVQNIALDIDRRTLPEGILCAPNERETFAQLSPGQSVSATFLLRVPMETPFATRQCVGDIAFRFFDASLRLFPQTW